VSWLEPFLTESRELDQRAQRRRGVREPESVAVAARAGRAGESADGPEVRVVERPRVEPQGEALSHRTPCTV
jgi:hypothetical protein